MIHDDTGIITYICANVNMCMCLKVPTPGFRSSGSVLTLWQFPDRQLEIHKLPTYPHQKSILQAYTIKVKNRTSHQYSTHKQLIACLSALFPYHTYVQDIKPFSLLSFDKSRWHYNFQQVELWGASATDNSSNNLAIGLLLTNLLLKSITCLLFLLSWLSGAPNPLAAAWMRIIRCTRIWDRAQDTHTTQPSQSWPPKKISRVGKMQPV